MAKRASAKGTPKKTGQNSCTKTQRGSGLDQLAAALRALPADLEALEDYPDRTEEEADEADDLQGDDMGSRQRHLSEGELRALRFMELLQQCQHDPDLALDLRLKVSHLPAAPVSYLQLVYQEGVISDQRAAQLLGVSEMSLTSSLKPLDSMIEQLTMEC